MSYSVVLVLAMSIWQMPESGSVPVLTGKAYRSPDTLYNRILSLDSLLFDAFNRRDSVLFNSLFSKDLEFYHDQGGFTGYGETTGFISRLRQEGSDLQRRLLPGTSEVYPVPGFGAIQVGQHEFCHTEKEKRDCGRFRFLHIWKQQGGHWEISRVVSYDH